MRNSIFVSCGNRPWYQNLLPNIGEAQDLWRCGQLRNWKDNNLHQVGNRHLASVASKIVFRKNLPTIPKEAKMKFFNVWTTSSMNLVMRAPWLLTVNWWRDKSKRRTRAEGVWQARKPVKLKELLLWKKWARACLHWKEKNWTPLNWRKETSSIHLEYEDRLAMRQRRSNV